jgi:hypothetical protein
MHASHNQRRCIRKYTFLTPELGVEKVNVHPVCAGSTLRGFSNTRVFPGVSQQLTADQLSFADLPLNNCFAARQGVQAMCRSQKAFRGNLCDSHNSQKPVSGSRHVCLRFGERSKQDEWRAPARTERIATRIKTLMNCLAMFIV